MAQGNDWTGAEIDEILDELRPVTVPVSITVEGKQRVLSMDESERILSSARLITLEMCSCREKIRGCDGPLDVCVCTDKQAEEAIEERGAWEVTLDTAIDALRKSHEAGLVHLAYETRASGKIEIICSCCACCCHTLAAITRFGYDREIIGHSDVIAVRDDGLCDNCGVCVERCHFKAWDMTDDRVTQNPEKCAGCSVCASSCPADAITLVRRNDRPNSIP